MAGKRIWVRVVWRIWVDSGGERKKEKKL